MKQTINIQCQVTQNSIHLWFGLVRLKHVTSSPRPSNCSARAQSMALFLLLLLLLLLQWDIWARSVLVPRPCIAAAFVQFGAKVPDSCLEQVKAVHESPLEADVVQGRGEGLAFLVVAVPRCSPTEVRSEVALGQRLLLFQLPQLR